MAEAQIDVRRFETLGTADHGWLDARHHFSFADYYHPARMNWGAIRVWNDDVIAARDGVAIGEGDVVITALSVSA